MPAKYILVGRFPVTSGIVAVSGMGISTSVIGLRCVDRISRNDDRGCGVVADRQEICDRRDCGRAILFAP
jgi:hypothetical protein